MYQYDHNGNLTEKVGAEEQVTYAYDSENHLIRVETTRYGATIVVEYAYDADGNRVRKTIDGAVVVNYLVDTNRDYAQVVEERDGNGNLLVRYVYGHDLISQTRPSAGSGTETSYYHYDGLGSTRALTNGSQVVTDTYTYDAFGVVLEQTVTTTNTDLYRGEQFDAELGFYYLRARYMDPKVGRFVTMDTFGGNSSDPITLHKYLYANANPLTYSDPSGHEGILSQTTASNMWGELSKIRVAALKFATLYPKLVGTIMGAVTSVTDAWLGGERDLADLAIQAIVGGGMGFVGGAAAGFIAKFPVAVCLLKAMAPLLGTLGLAFEVNGIKDSLERGDWDQAAFRTFMAYFTVKGVIHAWKTAACFTGDTPLTTGDGEQPIKDIQVGDEVYSENPDTGERGFKRVTCVFVRETSVLVHVHVKGEDIRTTPEHPFWVIEKGWTPAKNLQVGDLVKLSSGERGTVNAVRQEILTEPVTVYNVEVEDSHTYFVGKSGILVHNICDILDNFRRAQEALEQFFEGMSPNQANNIAGAVAIGAVDPFSGNVVVGKSKGGIPENVHSKLQPYLERLQGLNLDLGYPPGACAEFDAANQLLHLNPNLNPEDILFSTPVNPRHWVPKDVCPYCQHIFNRNQFAGGTGFVN